jgi:hypothetical protein
MLCCQNVTFFNGVLCVNLAGTLNHFEVNRVNYAMRPCMNEQASLEHNPVNQCTWRNIDLCWNKCLFAVNLTCNAQY